MSDKTPKKPSKPKTKEQELEEENKYLRAENAYLKKVVCLNSKGRSREKEKSVDYPGIKARDRI